MRQSTEPGPGAAATARPEAAARPEAVTRGQEVRQAIRSGIACGRHPGGARLNEADLAAALNVSRTPVRSALAALAAEGLLDYTPNSGYTVRRFTSRHIADIFEVRVRLEGLAAGLAARNGLTPAQHARMHELNVCIGELVGTGRWDAAIEAIWGPLNTAFHEVIYEAAGNPYLVEMILRANDVPFFAMLRWRSFDAEALRRTHEEHLEIFDAICRGEVARAEFLQGEHVYRSGRRMMAQWSRTAPGPAQSDAP